MQPRLTILLLCWNHERYLEQCIGALAAQTSGDFDVVFLDNVSTDKSAELAARLLAEAGIAHRILTNDRPQTIAANLNRMLAESKGDLVTFLSTDDWFAPRYVETMLDLGDHAAHAAWLSCGGWLDFEEEELSVPLDEDSFDSARPATEVLLNGNDPHFFVGCAYRRTALLSVGGWDEAMLIEDRDLFLRLSLRFDHRRTSERLVHYRRSTLTASANALFMLKGWELFYGKHVGLFGPRLNERRAETFRSYAAILVDQGKFGAAFQTVMKSVRLQPLNLRTWRTFIYFFRRMISSGLSDSQTSI